MSRMVAQIGARERSNTQQQKEPGEVDDFMHLIGDALGMNQTTQGHKPLSMGLPAPGWLARI